MAEKDKIEPIVPINPPIKGMIIPKFGGLVKIGHGAVDADGKRTDLPVGSMTRDEIFAHNQRVLEQSQNSSDKPKV